MGELAGVGRPFEGEGQLKTVASAVDDMPQLKRLLGAQHCHMYAQRARFRRRRTE